MNSSQSIFEMIKYQIIRFRFPLEDIEDLEIRDLIESLKRKLINPNKQILYFIKEKNFIKIRNILTKYSHLHLPISSILIAFNNLDSDSLTLEEFLPF